MDRLNMNNGALWKGHCYTWDAWNKYYKSINAPHEKAESDWYAAERCDPYGTLADYGRTGHLTFDQMPQRKSTAAWKYRNPLKDSDGAVSWEDALNNVAFQQYQNRQQSNYPWSRGGRKLKHRRKSRRRNKSRRHRK